MSTGHGADVKADYAAKYCQGFKDHLSNASGFRTNYDVLYDAFNDSKAAQQCMMPFLERSYLKHFDELSKLRPTVEGAAIWIGQNAADYGLLVSPRFAIGDLENDKSEIRHFSPKYWSIAHVLETGLVIPEKNKTLQFGSGDKYLDFIEEVVVRHPVGRRAVPSFP